MGEHRGEDGARARRAIPDRTPGRGGRPSKRPAEDSASGAGLAVDPEQSLGSKITRPLDWDENLDAPYFTGRPGWDGFGSLVLWAAYAEHPALRQPATLPEEWDNDPALMRSNVAGFRSRYSHLVRNVELWLPSPFEFTFEGEDIDGRRVVVGSTSTLHRQLDELNAATWKARRQCGGGPGTASRWPTMRPLDTSVRAMRLRCCSTSPGGRSEHRLPMKLDY